jgi:hypothetical protein
MRNTWRFITAMMIVTVLALVACSPQPAEPTQAPSYPAPEQSSSGSSAYIAPQQSIEFVSPNPYPIPESAEEVDWAQVASLVNDGQVAEVLQTVSLKVVITTKDGRSLFTQQPQPNDIFTLIESCGTNCAEIKLKSEF